MKKLNRFIVEVFIILAAIVGLAYVSFEFDFFDKWYQYTRGHEEWELDELSVIFILVFLASVYLSVRYILFIREYNFSRQKDTNPARVDSNTHQSLLPLKAGYVLAISIIGALLIVGHFVSSHAIMGQSYDATVINTSGRQRTLSQRLALLTAQLIYPENREQIKRDLRLSADEMRRAHLGLRQGNVDMGLPGVRSEAIRSMYFDKNIPYGRAENQSFMSLDGLVLHYLHEVDEGLELPDEDITPDNPLLRHTINDYHNKLLPLLHDVVNQYEEESTDRVMRLREIELWITFTILLTLALETVFIFRPMLKSIERRTMELLDANQELERRRHDEKFSALGQLSSGLAHEINNSLQPILGLGEIVRNHVDGKDQKASDCIEIILNSAYHAKSIVGNILEFSRRDSNQDLLLISARRALGESVAFARSLLSYSINVEIDDTNALKAISSQIYCNKTQIVQVFINLFKNAAQATEETGTVIVGFENRRIFMHEKNKTNLPDGDYIIVTVADNGPGIDEDIVEDIFNPFFTTRGDNDGTGLGLSTVHGIMAQHGGAVTVQSKVGKGTTFYLFFPTVSLDDDRATHVKDKA